MKNELWKNVVGYEDIYQVSDQGRIKNVKTKRILKTAAGGRGYPIVQLSNNGKSKTVFLHRIIAIAFLGFPTDPKLTEVHHKNHIRTDARLDNLQWTTPHKNHLAKLQNMEWVIRYNDFVQSETIEYMI